MSHLRLILHGNAAGRPLVREAVETARLDGHHVDVRVTWEAGDAVRFAKQAGADGVDTVVAGGGDGTLNEVVAGLLDGSGPPDSSVALLPLGTANDFAQCCGIPVDDPVAALRLAADGDSFPMDVGTITGRAFVNVATGGLGTKVTLDTSPEMKTVLGKAAYVLTGLRHLGDMTPVEGCFTGPDFRWEGRFWAMAVGNGRMAGGGVELCPGAILDDGLLELRIFPELLEEERAEKFRALLDGLLATDREVVSRQLPWLEVEVPSGLDVNLDGEPVHRKTIRFEVLKHWIRFHLPPSAPLLAAASRAGSGAGGPVE